MPETRPPLTLQTLLALNPHTSALRSGELRSPLVNFDFADVKTANKVSKPWSGIRNSIWASLRSSHFCRPRRTASRMF